MTSSNTLARQQPNQRTLAEAPKITLQQVTEMTGYDLGQVAMIRHNMAVSMRVRPEDVPLYDIAVFCHATRELDLDPMLRQAYWISRQGKGALQVGIDGYRAIAERSGIYAGSQPPEFRDWFELSVGQNKVVLAPGSARVTVWKIIAGRSCAFTGEAYWDEWYPGPGTDGFMYRKMPRHMLAKDAEAQALRKAFPAILSKVEYASAIGSDTGDVAAPSTVVLEEQPRPQPHSPERSNAEVYRAAFEDNYPDDRTQASYQAPPEESEPETEQPSDGVKVSPEQQEALERNGKLITVAREAGVKGLGPLTANETWPLEAIEKANAELEKRIQARNGDAEIAKGQENL